MLGGISWTQFLAFLFFGLVIYYGYVCLKFGLIRRWIARRYGFTDALREGGAEGLPGASSAAGQAPRAGPGSPGDPASREVLPLATGSIPGDALSPAAGLNSRDSQPPARLNSREGPLAAPIPPDVMDPGGLAGSPGGGAVRRRHEEATDDETSGSGVRAANEEAAAGQSPQGVHLPETPIYPSGKQLQMQLRENGGAEVSAAEERVAVVDRAASLGGTVNRVARGDGVVTGQIDPELLRLSEALIGELQLLIQEAAATRMTWRELEGRIAALLKASGRLVGTKCQLAVESFLERSCRMQLRITLEPERIERLWKEV